MSRPRGETAALLVAANRAAAYGTIARSLLHDLRSPAQTLLLVNDLANDPDGVEELRGLIRESAEQLAGSLELLDRALLMPPVRSEAGPVIVRDVLEAVGSLLRSHQSRCRIEMAEALAAPLPAVEGVGEELEHALLNLLLNAVEAIGERAGTVTVAAAASGAGVEITVDDDGPGVSSAMRERLFEPFATTKSGTPLAGLGLPVTRWRLDSRRPRASR